MKTNVTVRELTAIELDRVGGGTGLHVPNPVFPTPHSPTTTISPAQPPQEPLIPPQIPSFFGNGSSPIGPKPIA